MAGSSSTITAWPERTGIPARKESATGGKPLEEEPAGPSPSEPSWYDFMAFLSKVNSASADGPNRAAAYGVSPGINQQAHRAFAALIGNRRGNGWRSKKCVALSACLALKKYFVKIRAKIGGVIITSIKTRGIKNKGLAPRTTWRPKNRGCAPRSALPGRFGRPVRAGAQVQLRRPNQGLSRAAPSKSESCESAGAEWFGPQPGR